ncbi:MAG: methylmalonyl Co-A mutase-associated GTPase MeaB [Anaerolineales bacterium]|nr:methylmalonyl Co-A mutase-associated GTPase MeaB [Anaerolineales bacterium]
MELVERVLSGDRLALARLLTLIENQEQEGHEALAALYSRTGRAHLVGITGAPGTGKSTLVNQLVKGIRSSEKESDSKPITVAVVAVDPSSPFSGGAILGDRIRMRDLAGDEGVFIRSMASRGALGGLARTTAGVVQGLDAAGFDVILIETVGAGQAEVDIARTAHTTVVISAPGMGDEVQAIKAGIMEIADILVVNKADLPGADNAMRALRATLEMSPTSSVRMGDTAMGTTEDEVESSVPTWSVPVLKTVSTLAEGIDALWEAIRAHREYLQRSGELEMREQERIRAEMDLLLRESLAVRFLESQPDGKYEQVLRRVLARELSPRQAIDSMLEGGID